jgi:hypothetical protein
MKIRQKGLDFFANRPAAISESILSDSRDLRRHFRVVAAEFGAGGCRDRLGTIGTSTARVRPSISRISLWATKGGKSRENESHLSPNATSGFATRVVSP